MNEAVSNSMQTNCIDCHMPKQPSRAITFQLSGSDTISSYLLRTHKIAVYSYEKNNVIKYLKKNKNI